MHCTCTRARSHKDVNRYIKTFLVCALKKNSERFASCGSINCRRELIKPTLGFFFIHSRVLSRLREARVYDFCLRVRDSTIQKICTANSRIARLKKNLFQLKSTRF